MEVVGFGLFWIRVCSPGSWEGALEWINEVEPTGVEQPWTKHEGPNAGPVPCRNKPGHTHYMFECRLLDSLLEDIDGKRV